MRLLQWLGERDRGFSALRRGGSAAIVMPALFAVGGEVLASPTPATFAAFGSFAMLLLVGFSRPMGDRLKAQLALGLLGGACVALGTDSRILAAGLRSDAAYMLDGPGAPTEAEHDRVVAAERAAVVDALRQDLVRSDGRMRYTAARMIWTGDYLGALRQTSGPPTDIPGVLTGSPAAS